MTLLHGYHVGILVADINEAAERFSAILGVTFNPPTTLFVDGQDAKGHTPVKMTVTYSREGPLHYELLQANEHDIYSIAHGEGLHHVGLWCPDPGQELLRLARINVQPQLRLLRHDGETGVWYSHPDNANGVRFEFVDERERQGIEAMMAGQGFPDYE